MRWTGYYSIFFEQFFGGSGEWNEKMKEHHKSRDNILLILMLSDTSEKPLKLMVIFHLLVGYKVNTILPIFSCKSSWKHEERKNLPFTTAETPRKYLWVNVKAMIRGNGEETSPFSEAYKKYENKWKMKIMLLTKGLFSSNLLYIKIIMKAPTCDIFVDFVCEYVCMCVGVCVFCVCSGDKDKITNLEDRINTSKPNTFLLKNIERGDRLYQILENL